MHYGKTLNRVLAGVGLALTTGLALAADPDYSTITAAVSVGAIAVAIVGMGAVKIGPNVAKWASNKLANFF